MRSSSLIEDIVKFTEEIIPQTSKPIRCCIYLDRAIIKHRIIAALGFSLEAEKKIYSTSLSAFAKRALKREEPTTPILTFLDQACKSCIHNKYFVSNACNNCVSRPCADICPAQAIREVGNSSFIDPGKCLNCGACLKVCPYHAIVYIPIPCEEICPVGAISRNSEGRQFIDEDKCISCGKCVTWCPFGAVVEKSQIVDVYKNIQNGEKIVAIVAPSIVGQFKYDIVELFNNLREVGFHDVLEVAVGADTTAQNEAAEFVEKMEAGQHAMGTSCCPAYVEAVKKHATKFLPFVSSSLTPMEYSAQIVKARMPDVKVVFIGPCVAKKHEGLISDNVDFVLTYEELNGIFAAHKDILPPLKEYSTLFEDLKPSKEGRGFPVSNGVTNAVINQLEDKSLCSPVLIDGLDKKNIKLLNAYAKKAPGNLIEVMSCKGGCMSGTGVIKKPAKTKNVLNKFLNE